MDSAELVQAGRLEEALSALQTEIRNKPDEPRLRVFLFQLNCVLGRLDKALNQLQVVAGLSAESKGSLGGAPEFLLAQIFRPVIACEMLRREVFEGKRTPIIFGEPMEWVGLLVQAAGLIAKGEFAAAAALRDQAFEAAPATAGTINGEAFEWIADADSRLGPMLEAIIDGKYYWVPFCRVASVTTEAPTDLRDLVWLPARFRWTNGGEVPGHIPVRYPATEQAVNDGLLLARTTDWQQQAGETYLGSGQRVLATDTKEYPLLGCRDLKLGAAPAG